MKVFMPGVQNSPPLLSIEYVAVEQTTLSKKLKVHPKAAHVFVLLPDAYLFMPGFARTKLLHSVSTHANEIQA